MTAVFPEVSINVTYGKRRNLKEQLSPSLFSQSQLTTKSQSISSKCDKKGDICDNVLVCRKKLLARWLVRYTR